jgi:hypothetical protein
MLKQLLDGVGGYQRRTAWFHKKLNELITPQAWCRSPQATKKLQNVMPVVHPQLMLLLSIVNPPSEELHELQHGRKVQAIIVLLV